MSKSSLLRTLVIHIRLCLLNGAFLKWMAGHINYNSNCTLESGSHWNQWHFRTKKALYLGFLQACRSLLFNVLLRKPKSDFHIMLHVQALFQRVYSATFYSRLLIHFQSPRLKRCYIVLYNPCSAVGCHDANIQALPCLS